MGLSICLSEEKKQESQIIREQVGRHASRYCCNISKRAYESGILYPSLRSSIGILILDFNKNLVQEPILVF